MAREEGHKGSDGPDQSQEEDTSAVQ